MADALVDAFNWKLNIGIRKNNSIEHLRLAERDVRFNVDALKRVAARAVGRDSRTGTTKLPEGDFNIFALCFALVVS